MSGPSHDLLAIVTRCSNGVGIALLYKSTIRKHSKLVWAALQEVPQGAELIKKTFFPIGDHNLSCPTLFAQSVNSQLCRSLAGRQVEDGKGRNLYVECIGGGGAGQKCPSGCLMTQQYVYIYTTLN